MDAEVLLCDFAEAINGKLYISGGGWCVVNAVGPIRCAVAIRLAVPWTEANVPHDLKLSLLTTDSKPVSGDQGPVMASGKFEVGRPPGLTQGEALVNALVINFDGLALPAGMYEFVLEIDNDVVSRVPFRVNRQEVPAQ